MFSVGQYRSAEKDYEISEVSENIIFSIKVWWSDLIWFDH